MAANDFAWGESSADGEALLPEEEFRGDASEEGVIDEIGGGEGLGVGGMFGRFETGDGFESDGGGWAGDHAFAALDAGGRAHGIIEIEADAGGGAFAGATEDIVAFDFAAGADAAVAEDAGGVIDDEDGGRVIERAAAVLGWSWWIGEGEFG